MVTRLGAQLSDMKHKLVGAFILAVAGAAASDAHADTSSWLSAGGGYGLAHSDARAAFDTAPVLTFALGVGSDPLHSIVVGGLIRSATYFTLGTDLQLSARIASGSFARGQWGLAFDLGPTWRTWDTADDHGHFPLHGMAILGAPWGLQLGVGADVLNLAGSPTSTSFVAVLEMDLLRLTIMRQGATDRWWENPAPVGGRPSTVQPYE